MKKLNIVLSILLILALGASVAVYCMEKEPPPANITVVTPPPQSEVIVPEWAKPAEPIVVDFGENIALSATFSTSGFTEVYKSTNVNDDKLLTYWEGREFPSEIVADLGEPLPVGHVVIRLNPNPVWAARTQNIEIQGSVDGIEYEVLAAPADYGFDPDTANTAVITIPASGELPVVQYVKIIFYSNTEASGGQAAELEIYME